MAEILCAKVHHNLFAFAQGACFSVFHPSGQMTKSLLHTGFIRGIAHTGTYWVSAGDDKRIIFHSLTDDLSPKFEM